MKARFLDVPIEQLVHPPHALAENWALWRGKPIEIDPAPVVSNRCPDGVRFMYLHYPGGACIHLIELDESALDAEVERVAASLEVSR